jgi:hypothetical protein
MDKIVNPKAISLMEGTDDKFVRKSQIKISAATIY